MGQELTIRDWEDQDMPQIAAMHARMNIGYPIPASFGPLFPVRKAVVDQNGVIIGAVAVKIVSEAFLWVNLDYPAIERARSVKMLNEKCAQAARLLGLEEVSAWLPPKLQRCFGKVLKSLGWRRSPWRNWSYPL